MEPFGGGPSSIPTFGFEEEEPAPDPVALLVALGIGPTHTIFTPAQEELLADEIEQMLDGYDLAMEKRWKKEKLIGECYDLVPQSQWMGEYQDASELISETLMSLCDQAHARLTGQLLSVQPLVNVEGVESVFPEGDSARIAELVQTFLDRYLRNEVRIERVLPLLIYPTVKFGTAVANIDWDPDKRTVPWEIVQNRDAVVWPAWETDWQKAEWAGHRTIYTLSGLRRLCSQLGVPPSIQAKVELELSEDPKETDGKNTFADLLDGGVDAQPVASIKEYGLVSLYQLYGNRILPGEDMPRRFAVIYERKTKTILASRVNDQWTGRHPTHPIRYKISGSSAWGQGVGHEALPSQAKDTMYDNLEHDVLKSSCFHVFLTRPGTIVDSLWDRPSPGAVIPTEDPKTDVEKMQLADSAPLEMLNYARAANERSKIAATGQAAVLSGQGDPNMKSGAGTGSTMALISEAGKKFGQIDRNVRQDLADFCTHTLELLVQYGEGAPFVRHLAPEDAQELIAALLSLPSGAPITQSLRISIAAPSATNNEEIRKQEQLVVYKMVVEHAQTMTQMFASQILMQTNPAGMVPYMMAWEELVASMSQALLEAHEVTGVKGKVPHVKDLVQPTPEQAQINMLMQQLQEAQMQLQSVIQMASASPAGNSGGGSGGSSSSSSSGGGGV